MNKISLMSMASFSDYESYRLVTFLLILPNYHQINMMAQDIYDERMLLFIPLIIFNYVKHKLA